MKNKSKVTSAISHVQMGKLRLDTEVRSYSLGAGWPQIRLNRQQSVSATNMRAESFSEKWHC